MRLNSKNVPVLPDADVVEVVFLKVVLSGLLPIVADYSLQQTLFDYSIGHSLESDVSKVLLYIIVPHSRVFLSFVEAADLRKVEGEVGGIGDSFKLRMD